MSFWIIFLIPVAILVLIGFIVDVLAKRRGKKMNLERGKNKSRNQTGDMYSESLKQNNRNLF